MPYSFSQRCVTLKQRVTVSLSPDCLLLQDTVTGFLLAGIGDLGGNAGSNYTLVDPSESFPSLSRTLL